VNVTGLSLGSIRKTFEIEAVIAIGKEGGLTIVSTLDNMLRYTCDRVSRLAGHRNILFQWSFSVGVIVNKAQRLKNRV
jgi:hypothetical protein